MKTINNKIESPRSKDGIAVDVRSVSKKYRIYHEKLPSLKNTIIKGRRTSYEEFLALDDISFTINHSQTVGIIGPNGSGKSTLLKLISKVIEPTTGEIVVNGPMSALLELGAGFHPDLTGKENIYINAAILGMRKRDVDSRLDEIIAFSELEKFIDTPVKNYSSGMYMRLGFSVAIHVNPDILLVDEVLAVGDQAFQAKCYKVIYDFMKRGKTIILVSHDLDTISDLCSSVAFLKDGRLEDMGKPLDIVSKYRAFVEEIEHKRIIEQQRAARQQIFKSVIEENRRIVSGDEISKLSNLSVDGQTLNRFGSGEAEITGIRILDRDGKEIDYCSFGDEISISYDVTFKADVEDPIFGLRITDYKQNIIYGTNSRLQKVRPGDFGKGERISVLFDFRVTLMGGEYSLSPAVGYNDTKTYCDWVNEMFSLNVMHNNAAEGVCDLDPSIKIKKSG